MKINHLFKSVFNSKTDLVYRGGAEKPQAQEASEHQKLAPAELRKELEAIAKQHISAAEGVVTNAENIKGKGRLSPAAEKQLAKVKQHILNLKSALRGSNQTLARTLKASGTVMRQNVEKGLEPYFKRQEREGDPLGETFISYNPGNFEVDVNRIPSLSQAMTDLFESVERMEYGTINSSSVNEAINMRYTRMLTRLAAARQLQRNRGTLPKETDANLDLARELHDTQLLKDASGRGEYVQEEPKALINRQARLMDKLLRTTGAGKMARGGVLDLGYVMIQRSKKGEAYMLSYAAGGLHKGEAIAIPVTTVIDMGFEKSKTRLESEIAKTERAADKAYEDADRLASKESSTQAQVERAYAVHERLAAKLDKLYELQSKLAPVGVEAFSSKAAANANKVADRMYKDLEPVRVG